MRWWGSVISVDGWTVASVRGELGHPKVSSALASEPEHANQISPQDLAILAIWRNTYKTCLRPAPAIVVYLDRPRVARVPQASFRRQPPVPSRLHRHLVSQLTPPLAPSLDTPRAPASPAGICLRATTASPFLLAFSSRGASSPSDPDLITGRSRGPYARAVLALVLPALWYPSA